MDRALEWGWPLTALDDGGDGSRASQKWSVLCLYSNFTLISPTYRPAGGRPCRSLCNPVPFCCLSNTVFCRTMGDGRPLPLLSFEPSSLPPIRGRNTDDYDVDDDDDDGHSGNPRRWYHYVPLCS